MAVTAQAGIFGFGPQSAKEVEATTFYRHKATLIDLGVMDDIRVGPLEIGSGPFPTFPYKAGYVVGGGVELQPRLEDSIGWLLYAALGDVATVDASPVFTHTFKPLAADQAFVRWMTLRKYIPMKEGDANTDLGEKYMDCKPVSLTLTLPNDAPITARWDFMGRNYELISDFAAGTPAVANTTSLVRASNVVTVVIDDEIGFVNGQNIVIAGVTDASFNGTFPIIEIVDSLAVTSLSRTSNKVTCDTTLSHGLETGDTVTITGATEPEFNGTFVVEVVDVDTFEFVQIGADDTATGTPLVGVTRTRSFKYNQVAANDTATVQGTATFTPLGEAWTWANAYEDWGSIPVGCELGGYIKFTGGGLTNAELPVVGARVTFSNQNLDIRQEKVYGSPFLEDITIIQRQVTFDVTIKWNDPQLYKALTTGSITGTEWSSSPLTGELNIAMVGSGVIPTSNTKFELDITAPEIMWQMNGPIQLAGGQAIIMRFTGTALEAPGEDYVRFVLKNGTSAYTWPV